MYKWKLVSKKSIKKKKKSQNNTFFLNIKFTEDKSYFEDG